MNVACPSCSTRYSVEDSRIPPSGVTIKCPKCSHSFVVHKEAAPAHPTDPSGLAGGPETAPIGQSGVLDFIGETAQQAGIADRPAGLSEIQIKRMNGSIEGPYGVSRVATMLRNSEFIGNETFSEDGRNWQPLANHPDLARVLTEMQQGVSATAQQYHDLPQPAAHRDLPGVVDPQRNLMSPQYDGGFGSAPGAGMGGGTDPSPPMGGAMTGGMGSSPAPDYGLGGPAGQAPPLGGGPNGESPMPGGGFGAAPSNGAPAGGNIDPSLLEVGEIPQLPSIWDQYKKPIIAFAAVMGVLCIGLYTVFYTDLFKGDDGPETPVATPAPPAPKAPPVKLADASEIRELIDQGSFEAFRSVLATLKSLGLTAPDNMLAYAKAHGLATLYYGTAHFPVAELEGSVKKLDTLDLAKAKGGNLELANLEILKARAALGLAKGEPQSAVDQLAAEFEQNKEDKEVALLLGLGRLGIEKPKAALEALDRAVVVDTAYAPALHAIGEAISKDKKLGDAKAAGWWLEKAINAEPKHSRSAVLASEVYAAASIGGKAREMIAKAADYGDKGLPPNARADVNYRAALAFQAAERAQDGLKYAKEAARLTPGDSRYVAAEAVAMISAGLAKDAITKISPALARDPADEELLIALARAHMGLKDIPKAYENMEKAKKAHPRKPIVYLWQGRFDYKIGKLEAAKTALTQAISLGQGKDAKPMLTFARLELKQGAIEAALKHAKKAVAADGGNATGHALLGECYRARGELVLAAETHEKAIELDHENFDAQLGLANTLRDMGARSPVPAESEQLARAVPIYVELIREHPDRSEVFLEYGDALALHGELDKAVSLYKDAATLDPTDADPHIAIAESYLDAPRPNLKAAEMALKKATELKPELAAVQAARAKVLYLQAKYVDARRAMDAAIGRSKRNADYYYFRGKVLEADGNLFEAIGDWEKAVLHNSRHAKAYLQLGRAAIEQNQFAKARKYFEKFRMASPNDTSIWGEYGSMYVKQNKHNDAIKAYNQSLRSNPADCNALLGLSEVYGRKGEDRKSYDFAYKAAQACPDDGSAQCKYGVMLAHSKIPRLGKGEVAQLQKCVALQSAPNDLKTEANQLLQQYAN